MFVKCHVLTILQLKLSFLVLSANPHNIVTKTLTLCFLARKDFCQLKRPSSNIGTCKRFEPLGNEVQGSFINVNPTPNNEASEYKRNKVPSVRHSQSSNSRNRTDRATQTSDSERNDPANQSAKRKEVFMVGDSILKNLQGWNISRCVKVKVSSFPGCNTMGMRNHIRPNFTKKTLMRL